MRKLKLFSLALMALFSMSMWGAAGDPTTSNAPSSGGTTKDYANTISVASGYVAGNVIYYISNNLTFISGSGIEANYLGIIFKPEIDITLDFTGFNGNSSDVNITYNIDSIADDAYFDVFANAGNNKISDKIVSDNGGGSAAADNEVLNYWKDNGVVKYSNKTWQSNGDNAPKNLAGQQNVTYFNSTRLVTGANVAITSTKSADPGTYSFMRGDNKFVFKAGKIYRIYSTRGSSKTGYASFTFVPVYQLTWDFDGGSSSETAGTDYSAAGYYAKGADLDYPGNASMSKAGFAFAGWSSSETTMPASNLTITAEWEALAYYDVTYTSAKGVAPSSESDVAFVNLSQITGVDGWRNTGWIANKDVTIDAVTVEAGELLANGKKAYLTDDTEFTAQWAQLYSVTYKANGATGGDAPIEGQHIAGEKFDIADQGSLEAPTNTFFSGWSYNTNTYTAGDEFEMPASDVEFTAIWLHHYAITYNKGAYGSGTIEAGEKIEGIAFTLSAERFTRENYVQVGWATTDGGEQAYSLGGTYTEDAAIELFPVWMEAESYTFTYSSFKTISQLENEGWEFNSASATPNADNGEFVNLVETFIANNIGTSALKNNKVQDMDDKALAFAKNAGAYAIFDLGEEVKIVDFSATLYGGSGSAFNETIEYLGANKSTVKKSYTNSLGAGNWQANNINKNDEVEDVRYIKIYGASKWVVMSALNIAYVSKYTISFAAGEGASGTMDAVQAYAGNNVILPACDFTAPTGKKFAAWTSTDVTITDGMFTMPAKDVTVTATYAQLYNITISDGIQKGTVTADKEQAIEGETVTLTVTPDAEYVATNVSYNGTTINPVNDVYSFTMPAANVTVTATFAKSSTALDNTEVGAKAVKTLKNGLLIIEKNGVRYNMLGERVQ